MTMHKGYIKHIKQKNRNMNNNTGSEHKQNTKHKTTRDNQT